MYDSYIGLRRATSIHASTAESNVHVYVHVHSLPDYVVCAETVNTFKNRLDKNCSDQQVLCVIITQICMALETVCYVMLKDSSSYLKCISRI